MADISSTADVIDVRDIIARVEELREIVQTNQDDLDAANEGEAKGEQFAPDGSTWDEIRERNAVDEDDTAEFQRLNSLLEDLKGNGGDEQWEGDWYPDTLIRDSYFETAMDELLEDIGEMAPFDKIPSYIKITVDYDALQMNYTSTEYDGTTYWYR
jgi:hypothetical protein